MNSKGIGAGQFIPFTQSKWNKGEFDLALLLQENLTLIKLYIC